MRTLADQIGRLQRVRERLASPVEFWKERELTYLELAREVTRQALMLTPPPDIDVDHWQRAIDRCVEAIGAVLLNGEEVGLMIWLSLKDQGSLDVTGGQEIFSKDTVQEWVAAGRRGEDGGKQLDERDTGKTDEEIANRVWWALYTGRSRNSAAHLRTFLSLQQEALLKDRLEGLLALWSARLREKVKQDWRAYVRRVARAA